MSLSLEFCEQRADEAAIAATGAALTNVRDRELRSEASWRMLASLLKAAKDGRKAADDARAEASLLRLTTAAESAVSIIDRGTFGPEPVLV